MTTREPDFDLEAPIWWDPKVRSIIWKPRTFKLGLLLVRGESLMVATARGVLFSARLHETRAAWPGVFDLPMCDLTVRGTVHRLFFCAPHPRSPQFHARIPTAVSAVMEARDGIRIRLASARIPAARWPSQITEPMGRKRMVGFRAVLEGRADPRHTSGTEPADLADQAAPPVAPSSPTATSAPLDGVNDPRAGRTTQRTPEPSG